MPLTFSEPDALARLYARSLFELARDGGPTGPASGVSHSAAEHAIAATLAELNDLLDIAKTDARFSEFLSSRILPPKARGQSLRNILKGRVSDLTLRFVLVLNAKDRLSHLPPIVAAFDELVQKHFGRVEVDVYTAAPAGEADLEAIRTRLKGVLGKEPVIHSYVEPSMVGGLKLQIGDQLIDASIAGRLRKLRDRLSNDGAAEVRARAEKFFQN